MVVVGLDKLSEFVCTGGPARGRIELAELREPESMPAMLRLDVRRHVQSDVHNSCGNYA